VRIGIDASELCGPGVGGVRTAVSLLLTALARQGADVAAFAPSPVEVPPRVRMVSTGGPRRPAAWRRSRALRRALRRVDLFHSPVTAFPRVRGLPVTATVHELPFVENYRLEGWRRSLAQQLWLARAMGECAALFAPSAATLRQMTHLHPASPRLTHVVPHPCPPVPPGVRRREEFFLFVGRLDRRKCVEAIFEGVARTGVEVGLAGPHERRARGRIGEAARKAGVRARFLGVVGPGELDRLYRAARAVALPSVSEGFGFPVLEALGRGVPVIVSKGTGAAETGGDAALAVDPLRADEIARAFERSGDPEYAGEVAWRGPARAAEFTFDRTARAYLEAFHRALGG